MGNKIRLSRLMFAAAESGSGKTALTCALLRLLKIRKLSPCAFKCGPDYIDPLFHRSVLNLPSRNLDLFFSDPFHVRRILANASAGHDLAVLEGVMGFYDGVGGGDRASSWHLAVETQTPVILVVTPRSSSLTLAAAVRGVAAFRRPSPVRGVLLNRCGQAAFQRLASMLERETGLPVLGWMPDMPECTIASRHLGLVNAPEISDLQEKIDHMARTLEQCVDIEKLLDIAQSAPRLDSPDDEEAAPPEGERPRIAVARDRAFCFYYEENLDELRRAGAEIVEFSPLAHPTLPPGTAGLYLGGGYPELHARRLSENIPMRDTIRAAVERGMPTLAECGGFLYLQESLEDSEDTVFPMVGALPGRGANTGKLGRFGYLTLTAREDTPYLPLGETVRAHEFHYWDSDKNGCVCHGKKPAGGREWDCMVVKKGCFAGFPHLYFTSNPEFAPRFVAACRRFREKDS